MKNDLYQISSPIVQSAIAGIANNDFCQKMLDYNAGMVILGGFSIDNKNYQATKEIIARGRNEFLPPREKEELTKWIKENLHLKKRKPNQFTAANVRFVELEEISRFWLSSLVNMVDFVELNIHCRQWEILNVGGGQEIAQNLRKLDNIIQSLHTILKPEELGIKIRGMVIKSKKKLVNLFESYEIQYIHVDAMLPGENRADLQLVKEFADITQIPIIGNNSVRNTENIKEMLDIGAFAVSLARPLVNDPEVMFALTNEFEGR